MLFRLQLLRCFFRPKAFDHVVGAYQPPALKVLRRRITAEPRIVLLLDKLGLVNHLADCKPSITNVVILAE